MRDRMLGVSICTGEVGYMVVERAPTAAEVEVIERYRTRYEEVFGFPAWGVHHISDLENHGPVLLPVPPEWAEEPVV